MEDISRELEKEIAQARPKPYKRDNKTRVLIVDDFGRMKSGEYLKYLLKALSIFSIVCFVGAVLFFKLHSNISKDMGSMKERLLGAEKKVETLTKEKEVLMARLVIIGKEPSVGEKEPQKKDTATHNKGLDKRKSAPIKKAIASVAARTKKNDPVVSTAVKKKKQVSITPAIDSLDGFTNKDLDIKIPAQKKILENNMVSIEKFAVKKDRASEDLLVRFDIRNASKEQGDVSGRIFTVLKPDNKPQDQWLVVPTAPLENGIPSEFRKGQYFSIAHFKPVKFRIKNTAGPDFFQKASIYIFNNQGELIFEKLIKITEADEVK